MDSRELRKLAEHDAVLGKSVEAFYDIPNIDHSDEARIEYEKFYRGTIAELEREGQ